VPGPSIACVTPVTIVPMYTLSTIVPVPISKPMYPPVVWVASVAVHTSSQVLPPSSDQYPVRDEPIMSMPIQSPSAIVALISYPDPISVKPPESSRHPRMAPPPLCSKAISYPSVLEVAESIRNSGPT